VRAEFLAATRRIMQDEECHALVDHLARNPLAGDLIPGTGGVRKLRWALEGRGKRGGARVVYYYHSDAMPIFALTAYAKNERADISEADRNDFRRLTALLVERYARRSR
jgi:hypothetical protein